MATDTERSSHKVYEKEQIGEVQIADEVVAIIAGLAATEVEGVDSLNAAAAAAVAFWELGRREAAERKHEQRTD